MPSDRVARVARALASVYFEEPRGSARRTHEPQSREGLQRAIEYAIRAHVQRCREMGLDDDVVQRRLAGWSRALHTRLNACDNHHDALDELGRFLCRGPASFSLSRLLTLAAVHWPITAVVLAVALALVTAALRLGYQSFYESLGMIPEDVGLAEQQIITRAALGAIAFMGWSSLYVLGVFLAVMAVLLPQMVHPAARHRAGRCELARVHAGADRRPQCS